MSFARNTAPLLLCGLGIACRTTWLAPGAPEDRDFGLACTPGTACDPLEVGALPATLRGDTTTDGESAVDRYACAPSTDEAGREVWYAVDLPTHGAFRATVDEVSGDGIDVDVHLLTQLDPDSCFARGDAEASGAGGPGTVYVVVDTWAGSAGPYPGPYTLTLTFTPDGAPAPPPPPAAVWTPSPGTSWQWQLQGAIDRSVDAQVYDVDLFDTSSATVDALHADGRRVICYFSAGSREDWRPDAARFPSAALGKPLDGWPGERWLDVRDPTVRAILADRLDLAAQKGCDAVEPDNVDGYANDDGFSFGRADQLDFLRFLSDEAHARSLSVGLKNATDLVPDLVSAFDWALNEECVAYAECGTEQPFVQAGKAVFHVEYVDSPGQGAAKADRVCGAAGTAGFSTLVKTWDLDAWRIACD